MPDLTFQVEGAEAVPYSAAPLLAFRLRVANSPAEEIIHSIALRCQVMIEVSRRRYSPQEQERLFELFGEPERWNQTLRTMLWTHASVVMPTFAGVGTIDLPVPCSFDFNIAGTKYFAGLDDGEIPLEFLFSGTVFYESEEGGMQVAQISWEKEAKYRLPVRVWQDMMNHYYPNTAWLCLRKDVFDRLYRHKIRGGHTSWEQALESVLPEMEESAKQ